MEEKKKFRLGLLPKVLIAIGLGILCSLFFPDWAAKAVATFNSLFSNFLGFIIPLLILGLVAPGIAEMGKGAGKLLLITVILAYVSTILAGYFSYFTCEAAYPSILVKDPNFALAALNEGAGIKPYFSIDMPPVFGVMTALILAFVLGLGAAYSKSETIIKVLGEFRDIINLIIKNVIIPLLPFFIFGIFLILSMEGQVTSVLKLFLKVILVIFAMHIVWLVFQFLVAGAISRKNPFKCLWNMLPAYMTALGTQSSAATIPVTLAQTRKNGVDNGVSSFTVPLCATIHLAGSTLKIVACAFAIMYMMGLPTGVGLYTGFIFMLGITMVAAPGVPGGAIMAALAVLESILGFDSTLQALMIALYITMDSFGTACNVTGDGAISLIVDRIYSNINKKNKKNQ
ncbi:MAG: dicarboxylate/amino acid:cation symporter [Bacteroidales bacterium]|nr:dicarboxylate/amino acid:cation symporter [Bacteroidales bacterium]MBR6442972.1 dicarboxylate/amino acid:cation symporter [Clostridia bacterium]